MDEALRCETAGKGKDTRGFALIAVLGFLAVMSMIAIGIVGASRASVANTSRNLLRVQAQAAAESAVNYALAELVAARNVLPDAAFTPRDLRAGDFAVNVTVRPEYAKVDLNHANANLLAILFRAGGADLDKAQALAAAVEDWRDGDDLLHLNGAERRQYAEAGLGYAPANAFFKSIDELGFVLGMTPALFACIRPEITIFAQRPGIDIENAAPWMRRAAGLADPVEDNSSSRGPLRALARGDVFEITARVDDTARNIRRAHRVIVQITGNPQAPYWILHKEAANPIDDAAKRNCPKPGEG
jgi:general secretion pathway protein K